MRYLFLAPLLALLATTAPANARGQSDTVGSLSTRSCHCDRYTDPHYSRYVPRSGPYRGGRATRY